MVTRVYSSEMKEMIFEVKYPSFFCDASKEITERSYYLDIFFGQGGVQEVFFDNIYIAFGEFHLVNDTRLYYESESEFIEMTFLLDGHMSTTSSALEKDFTLGEGFHNIVYTKDFKGSQLSSAQQTQKILKINLSPSSFLKYFPDSDKAYEKMKVCMEQGKNHLLFDASFHITSQMYSIIADIMGCRRKGLYKKMYLESKVIELLMLQMEQSRPDIFSESLSLKKHHIEKLYQVKELLEDDITSIMSLTDMAKKVGSNTCTLKRGFKELFGTSIYSYWKGLRLEKAKTILTNEQISVKEVARKIGYRNPEHFTSAFKKQFGVSPSKFKN
ncbi:MAG: AraC family transcriptional regulator [Bacteroidota bacterium]